MNDETDYDWEGEEDFDDWFSDLWEASLEPPEWIIENLLPSGIVFMIAPPKTFKSTIEMAWSLAVAGEPCDALPADMCKVPEGGDGIVIGASAEATPGELRYMVEQGMSVKDGKHGRIRLLKDPWKWRLDDPDAVGRLIRKLEQVKPRLFWLDPLVHFHSLDEVNAGEMSRLLRPLQQWAKRNRVCFLVVHHTRKRNGQDADRNLTAEDARGTGALFGLADGLIALTPKGKNRVHFAVTLKRGQPMERTVTLKVWGEGEAQVAIDGNAKAVFEAMLGVQALSPGRACTQAELGAGTGLSQPTVSRALSQLKSMGAVDKDGFAVPTMREAVRAATKTMQKEMQ